MKQGQVRRLKNGKWQIRVQKKSNGERKSFSEIIHGTRDDANDALKTLLADLKKIASAPKPTYKTFNNLFDDYLLIIKPNLREQTYYLYENIIRRYLRTPFGEKPLTELTGLEIEKFYAGLQSRLSAETIYKIHVQFKTSYKKARQWKWVTEDPFEFVKPPKRVRSPKDILTPDELNLFFDACDDLRTKTLWLFFALTGARSQEVLGARWRDIKENVWNVSQVRIETTKVKKFDEPKTEKSKRSIPLEPELVAILKKLKVEQNIERLQSAAWADNDLIFSTGLGNPLRLSNLGEKCSEIATRAGITKKVHPHLFRHTFASLGLKAGVGIKFISEFLGHANISITANIYSHVNLDDKREVSSAVAGMILRK